MYKCEHIIVVCRNCQHALATGLRFLGRVSATLCLKTSDKPNWLFMMLYEGKILIQLWPESVVL